MGHKKKPRKNVLETIERISVIVAAIADVFYIIWQILRG